MVDVCRAVRASRMVWVAIRRLTKAKGRRGVKVREYARMMRYMGLSFVCKGVQMKG
jgi:hypothetical protein